MPLYKEYKSFSFISVEQTVVQTKIIMLNQSLHQDYKRQKDKDRF